MDPLDNIRTGDGEQVVIPFEIVAMILEPITPKIFLGQRVALDHRSHRTVEQCNPPCKEFSEGGIGFVAG